MAGTWFSGARMLYEYGLKRKISHGASVLWHLRVAEGDHLTERSEGRKLPQHKTRALAVLRKLKTLLGGAPGGMQGGPRRGRSPITGPALPCAAWASQLRRRAKPHARRAVNKKNEPQHQPRPVIKVFAGMGVWGKGRLRPLPPTHFTTPYLLSAPSGVPQRFHQGGAQAGWWAVPEGTADSPCQ